MILKFTKFIGYLLVVVVLVNLPLAAMKNVNTDVSGNDIEVFESVLNAKKPDGPLNYQQEVELIREMQALVFKLAPLGPAIPLGSPREPADLFRTQHGVCYDRSRTFDKLFKWLGFETRHVYILYLLVDSSGAPLPIWKSLISKRALSHAATEVKTQRGWVLVDSNSAWISVARTGEPIDAGTINAHEAQFDGMPDYFRLPSIVIRGLYSRGGSLYPPDIPYPGVNWSDFARALLTNGTR